VPLTAVKRRTLKALPVVIQLAVAAGVAVLLIVATRPPHRTLPNLVGSSLPDAARRLAGAGLAIRIEVSNAPGVPDAVVSQRPRPGTRLTRGDAVTLTITHPPQALSVPAVEGLHPARAEAVLRRAGLRASLERVSSSTVPARTVAATMPPAGSLTGRGSRIRLLVSAGPRQRALATVVGQPEQSAIDALLAEAVRVVVVREAVAGAPLGTVVRQAPPAGQRVAQGSVVQLTVSSPGARRRLPNVAGRSEHDAASLLSNLELRIRFVDRRPRGASPRGTILSQAPPPGTWVVPGALVTLAVAT
jgi:serine/threonine-protein kinase